MPGKHWCQNKNEAAFLRRLHPLWFLYSQDFLWDVRVLKKVRISEGEISGTVVDPKKIFQICLAQHTSSIILGHNHPSGNIQPSEADNKITKKIKDCGIMLDVAVLDHIIIGDDRYYSFADEGSIWFFAPGNRGFSYMWDGIQESKGFLCLISVR